jgi:hypothetical protein
MQVAQRFLAALARDWDGPLDALKDRLDQRAREPTTTPLREPEDNTADHGFTTGRWTAQ